MSDDEINVVKEVGWEGVWEVLKILGIDVENLCEV